MIHKQSEDWLLKLKQQSVEISTNQMLVHTPTFTVPSHWVDKHSAIRWGLGQRQGRRGGGVSRAVERSCGRIGTGKHAEGMRQSSTRWHSVATTCWTAAWPVSGESGLSNFCVHTCLDTPTFDSKGNRPQSLWRSEWKIWPLESQIYVVLICRAWISRHHRLLQAPWHCPLSLPPLH